MSSASVRTPDRRIFQLILLLQIPLLMFVFLTPETFLGFCIVLLGAGCILWLADDLYRLVFFFVLLISWFPEYSQTDWDVWSADDFHSLYNYKPIPWITASVFDYLFALAVLMWIVKVAWPKRHLLLQNFLAKPLLIFIALSVVSLALGVAKGYLPYYALREFRVSAYFVLFYFMALGALDDPQKRTGFLQLLTWTGIAVGIVGIIRHRLGIGKEYYGDVLIYYDIADSMVMYVAVFVLASYWLVRRKAALAIAVVSFPLLFSLLFSYRRGAWIACAAGLLVLLWIYRSKKKEAGVRRRWLAPTLVLACAVVAVYSAFNWQDLLAERVTSIVDVYDDTSNVFRIMDTLNALITFTRHPILGIGSGGQYDFEFYSEAVAPSVFWENASRACHNGYLYILFKMGIIGFLAYIAIFYKFVRRWIKLRRKNMPGNDQIIYYALGTGVVAILVNNLTSPVADSLRPALLLAALMACVSTAMPSENSIDLHDA